MAQMLYSANSKSVGVAYLLWLFLGGFGGHRFYSGKTGTAIAQLALTLLGLITAIIGVGVVLMFFVALWALIDAFLIPGWIRNHNMLLAHQMAR
ncbi:TM2 domain-containing protein [Sphingomonas sp. PL-96]|uniref:TM2 domain-containing protein n=1 Tax=Sphingomonas sp. PL-96 TaxID=2887201 RepID=UPI001E30DAEE|nr:TM2 domain-containing protein [Sphingomonas sp. PL-96]MCC2975729.1 TM2 domain-containing protein [Sphingomonas sp. PL-96]